MGHRANDWHDTLFVLNGFGKQTRKARTAYRDFVEKGISLGRQPNLVGGGLVRSSGGWSEVKALRRIGEKKGDERILGSGNFVSQVLSEADLVRQYRLANLDREKAAFEIMEHVCKENDILIHALMGGQSFASYLQCQARTGIAIDCGIGVVVCRSCKVARRFDIGSCKDYRKKGTISENSQQRPCVFSASFCVFRRFDIGSCKDYRKKGTISENSQQRPCVFKMKQSQ